MPRRRGSWELILAQRKIGLVFGGGRVGMMGQLAQAALENGGEVIGVIPRELHERKVAFSGLTDLRVVESMHERKALMAELSDGFMALPGGLGTLEEIFEILTWAQLGMHGKPCGLLNVAGYFTPLLAFLDRVAAQGFIDAAHRSMILTAEDPEELLRQFEALSSRPLPTRRNGRWGRWIHEEAGWFAAPIIRLS